MAGKRPPKPPGGPTQPSTGGPPTRILGRADVEAQRATRKARAESRKQATAARKASNPAPRFSPPTRILGRADVEAIRKRKAAQPPQQEPPSTGEVQSPPVESRVSRRRRIGKAIRAGIPISKGDREWYLAELAYRRDKDLLTVAEAATENLLELQLSKADRYERHDGFWREVVKPLERESIVASVARLNALSSYYDARFVVRFKGRLTHAERVSEMLDRILDRVPQRRLNALAAGRKQYQIELFMNARGLGPVTVSTRMTSNFSAVIGQFQKEVARWIRVYAPSGATIVKLEIIAR